MSYKTYKIGKTGPSSRIGGSSDYHIDTKFSSSLSMEDVRDRFDALARQYQSDGRTIEFSNQGVSGRTYSLDSSPEDRLSLLQQASGAHSERPGWHSFDYYAPLSGTTRWDKSAEGAPIYVVGGQGTSGQGASGGGYGNYGLIIKGGKVISKSGHGDTNGDVWGGYAAGQAPQPITSSTDWSSESADGNPQQTAKMRAKAYSEMSKQQLDSAYDALRDDPGKAKSEGMLMHKAYFGKK